MDVKAAVAHQAGARLSIETVSLEGPRSGEVLVEIKATGICHTDEFTRSGAARSSRSERIAIAAFIRSREAPRGYQISIMEAGLKD